MTSERTTDAERDRAVLLRALDALEQGLAFFDGAGGPVHANRAFGHLLESVGRDVLGPELQHFTSTLLDLALLRGLADEVQELAVREVRAGEQRLRMRGSYVGLDLFGRGACILVTLEPSEPDPLSDTALQRRFGLSRQECRVLRLLIGGRTNKEIAQVLCLSHHTVRHHLESVFGKLQVHSRAGVAGRLLGD